ncbi:OmpA family protein [Elusimicrobiota bacterium]
MNIKKFLICALCVPLLASCVAKSKFLAQEQKAASLADKNKELKTNLNIETQGRAALKKDNQALKDENEKLLSSLNAKKDELSKTIAELTVEKQDLTRKLSDTEKKSNDTKKVLQEKISDLTKTMQEEITNLKSVKAQTEKVLQEEIANLKNTHGQLVTGLKKEIESGQITVTQLKNKLTVNVLDKILFDSGHAGVKDSGKKVLKRIGNILKKIEDKDIRIEGHTDNVPISASLRKAFFSNWELSAMRATNVVRYLQYTVKIDPKRLIAAGFGPYRPIASNKTAEGKAQNRRIELILVPSEKEVVIEKKPEPKKK